MERLSGPERDEQFLRGEPREPRRWRRLARLLRVLAVVSLSGLAAAGIWTVVASGGAPELAVDRILVEGNERLSDGEILELIEVSESTNILTLELDEVRGKLLRSAWVREVELERVLPGTLTLQIAERRPAAIAALDELYLLAGDGTILDLLPPHYDASKLILVRGLREESAAVSAELAAVAGRISEALQRDERLGLLVSELDVTGGRDSIALRLREPPITLLVSEDTAVQRLEQILPLVSGILERFPALAVVDLRFEERIYLRLNEAAPIENPTSTASVTGGAPF